MKRMCHWTRGWKAVLRSVLIFVDSNCRLTILTPSRIAVRVSTQTFLPSSHFETAEENRYESSRPDTIR